MTPPSLGLAPLTAQLELIRTIGRNIAGDPLPPQGSTPAQAGTVRAPDVAVSPGADPAGLGLPPDDHPVDRWRTDDPARSLMGLRQPHATMPGTVPGGQARPAQPGAGAAVATEGGTARAIAAGHEGRAAGVNPAATPGQGAAGMPADGARAIAAGHEGRAAGVNPGAAAAPAEGAVTGGPASPVAAGHEGRAASLGQGAPPALPGQARPVSATWEGDGSPQTGGGTAPVRADGRPDRPVVQAGLAEATLRLLALAGGLADPALAGPGARLAASRAAAAAIAGQPTMGTAADAPRPSPETAAGAAAAAAARSATGAAQAVEARTALQPAGVSLETTASLTPGLAAATAPGVPSAMIERGLLALGLGGDAAAANAGPLAERAGVIASFILNAHFLPGWPPPRPIENAEAKAFLKQAEQMPKLTKNELETLTYLANFGFNKDQLARVIALMLRARRRSKLLDAIAHFFAGLGATMTALHDELELVAEELNAEWQTRYGAGGGRRARLELR